MKTTRKRWSPKERAEMLRRWRESGQSAAAFGRANGIGKGTLHGWSHAEKHGAANQFIEVKVKTPAKKRSLPTLVAMALELRSGRKLLFDASADPGEIRRWADELDRSC